MGLGLDRALTSLWLSCCMVEKRLLASATALCSAMCGSKGSSAPSGIFAARFQEFTRSSHRHVRHPFLQTCARRGLTSRPNQSGLAKRNTCKSWELSATCQCALHHSRSHMPGNVSCGTLCTHPKEFLRNFHTHVYVNRHSNTSIT